MIIDKLKSKFSNYEVEKIDEKNATDVLEILKNNEYFVHSTQNHEPVLQDAIEDIQARPEGLSMDDKTYCIMYMDEKPMFILDYLEKYPDEKSAYIGLFILNGAYHKKGFGKIIFDGLVEISRELNFSEIHLGCMKKNEIGYKFWNKNGFEIIGEVVHNIDDVDFEIYRMKKSID